MDNKMKLDDWVCVEANCGNVNFARRTSCNRCNKEKPDDGVPTKKKTPFVFDPKDWKCNKCANVNWARRLTCNVCKSPKFGEVVWTGYGAECNERVPLEYSRQEGSGTSGEVRVTGDPRKRQFRSDDIKQSGSSGYYAGPKRSKPDDSSSPLKAYNPVMENMVSSTNNDEVYKFTGHTLAEDLAVPYSVQERVIAAAYAIVYNNCKTSSERFKAIFKKPPPDFKTIFSWRKCLLSTGCLVDSHFDISLLSIPQSVNKASMNSLQNSESNRNIEIDNEVPKKIANPDEIPISFSDSEDDTTQNFGALHKSQAPSDNSLMQRNISVETLVYGDLDAELNRPGMSVITNDEGKFRARGCSRPTEQRNRYRSHESPHSISDKVYEKMVLSRNNMSSMATKNSSHDSDSDSDIDDFLSRMYKANEDCIQTNSQSSNFRVRQLNVWDHNTSGTCQ